MDAWLVNSISGSLSCSIGIVVGHPLDTIKCRMQINKEYKNITTSFFKIVKEEKFKGLYKGIIPPMINQFPINALFFSEYYRMHKIINNYFKENKYITKGMKYILSGMYVGFVVVMVSNPSEILKMKMQSDKDKYRSLFDVAKNIYNNNGIRGFYKGYCVTLNRDFISYGLYFYTYFKLKDYFKETKNEGKLNMFFAGGMAGVVSWLVGYPFDPMKTLIQTSKTQKTMSQREAFKIILHKRGFLGFFSGISPVLVRAFMQNGTIFVLNEKCRSYISLLLNIELNNDVINS